MKKRKIGIILLILSALVFLKFKNTLYDSIAIKNNEGEEVTVNVYKNIFSKYANVIEIVSENRKEKIVFSGKKKINIWKLDAGDVDGDGIDEIALGVYKKSPHHRVMANRVFLYNISGLELKPKFRASRLGLPFTEFLLYDIDEDGAFEIISIEEKDNYKFIAAYNYKNFSIYRDYISHGYEKLAGLDKRSTLSVNADGKNKKIELKGKEIELK
ncbi:FG-GAP repeat protein [Peptoniphilus sp. oral taxon 386]|uniref:FG-GAP repeat protein n=1 Tax=Peptoniphilus sp. oral taxon 386 TaxID=652713 RepID=UPI00030DC893|nr:FG-GAP repeat protein [Peptoniphilus sp. oral taxon 386]